MKKTLIAVAAAAALTTSAFAELSFGTWTNSFFTPVANDGVDTVSNMGMSWGGSARTGAIDFHFKSEEDLAGMDFSYRTHAANTPSGGDYSQIWVKPVDMLKLSYGKYDNNTLRGDCCYGAWNWLRPTSAWIAGDEGLLMSGNGKTGVLFEVTPAEGLYVQALLPITDATRETADMFKNMQAGFAYNIDGIGKIKAQMILNNTPKKTTKAAAATYGWKDEDNNPVTAPVWTELTAAKPETTEDARLDKIIEAEFDLTSVENLWVGVGVQFNMYADKEKTVLANRKALDSKTYSGPTAGMDKKNDIIAAGTLPKMKIALGATYQVNDELKVSASGAYFTYEKDGDEGMDARFQAGFGVDYNLGDGMAFGADVRYLSKAKYNAGQTHYRFCKA